MEGVLRAAAVGRRIGERTDDLEQLEDRARPAMGHDQRQRVRMMRADVDEMDVEPVDLGDELREGVQLRLDLAPVVVGLPVAHELLELCELHALRPSPRPSPGSGQRVVAMRRRRSHELLVGDVDAEGADRIRCVRSRRSQAVRQRRWRYPGRRCLRSRRRS